MNPKWVIRVVVIAALVGLVVWIARNTYWTEVPIDQPLQGDAADDPFYSASKLAELLGARARWQRVLGSMPPRAGIVLASGWHWGLMASRRERLQRWVAAGGRLVLDPSVIGGQKELERWSGISRSEIKERRKPGECWSLTDDSPASARNRFSVCNGGFVSALHSDHKTSWVLRDTSAAIQVVRVPVGLGSVTVINAVLFGNRAILKGDHAALFVAATQLRRGDPIWFLTEERGASLLGAIWSTGAPVVVLFLALIAAWLWRSGTRFGPPVAATEGARRSLAEQIRGTGQFTLRFGGGQALYAAQVRALRETAERLIPGYARLSDSERVTRLAQLSAVDAGALAAALDPGIRRRPGGLRHGLALLESIRRILSRNSQSRGRS